MEKPQVFFLDESLLARWPLEIKFKSQMCIRCFDELMAFFKMSLRTLQKRLNCAPFITDHYSPLQRIAYWT
jgi:hypothetical protein